MASIELLDEETLNVTLSDDIGLESNINESESINVEQLPNDYTPSYTESDPIFVSSPAASIKEDDITNWNSKSDFDGDYESLTNKPTIPTVPTNLSSFTDDLGSSPTHTHSQYLTEHQDISGKVDKETGKGLSSNDFTDTYKSNVDSNTTARHTHRNKSVLDDINTSDISNWDSKQETLVSGTNIKTINNQSILGSGNITIQGGGSGDGDMLKSVYDTNDNGIVDNAEKVNNHTVEKDVPSNAKFTDTVYDDTAITQALNNKADSSDIPTKTSDLTNDSGFLTSHQDISGKADKSEIPTKVSELTNDSGYISSYTETDPVFTSSAAHEITSTDITNWNNKSTFSGSYNDLTNKPTIPDELSDLSDDSTHRLVTDTEKSIWNAKSDFSGSYNDLTDTPTIPTKTSDLTNDSGFLTSHQDISVKENISNKITSIDFLSTDTQYPSAKCVYNITQSHLVSILALQNALGLSYDTYNGALTYNSGDTVVYNHTVYECNTNGTTGTWNSSKWDFVPIIVND